MKIVSLGALLSRLQPLLSRRWLETPGEVGPFIFDLASDQGRFRLRLGNDGVSAEASPGNADHSRRVARAFIPQRWLTGLLTGYHTVQSIAGNDGVRVPDQLMHPLRVLFPPGCPFVYQGDNH